MIKKFQDIDGLSPSDFELFVKELFEASGWTGSVLTKVGKEFKHGDGGVDIFAYKNKRKFAIEVKQRDINYTVDVKALNQLVTGAALANVTNKILVTNSYYTSEVKVRALRLGVELIDRDELQNLWVKKRSEIGKADIKPWKHQIDVIDEAIEIFKKGKSKILIEMATGLGKTYTVAHLLKKLILENNKKTFKVLFIAHQVEILLQSVTAFKNVLGIGNYSFSACFSGSAPEDTDFVFATFDTLYGQLNNLSKNTFDFVVVDEAHHTPARTYAEVVTLFEPKLLIGLTATPFRADNKDVIRFFGGADGHIGKYDLVWALKHKKLAFPKYLVLLDDLNQEKIDQLESGLTISDLDKRLFLHKKDEEVIRIIEKTVKEQNIQKIKGIVFCRNIKHMTHLIKFFEIGTATLVHSKMSDNERRENIRNFREGDFKFILVCDLFNEGIDIPETNLLIFMRYTGSRTIWLQQLGRGLRKTPNKEFVHVLDFVGSLDRLNEVKQLSNAVEKVRVNRESLLEEIRDINDIEYFHDSSLEVIYSTEAARVLTLIETMKMKLNSREILLEKMRDYFNENNKIPLIEEVERDIENISLDQISTHFGTYYNYLKIAFGDNFYCEKMVLKLKKHFESYIFDNKSKPSFRAISNHFMFEQLYEFSQKEVELLLSNIEVEDVLFVNKINEMKQSVVDFKEKQCYLINRYKGQVLSRSDLKKISLSDLDSIKNKYISVSAFLGKLREI